MPAVYIYAIPGRDNKPNSKYPDKKWVKKDLISTTKKTWNRIWVCLSLTSLWISLIIDEYYENFLSARIY